MIKCIFLEHGTGIYRLYSSAVPAAGERIILNGKEYVIDSRYWEAKEYADGNTGLIAYLSVKSLS